MHIKMEKTFKQEHELIRQQFWANAWCAVANANDCKESVSATNWANRALKDFDAKFDPLREPV